MGNIKEGCDSGEKLISVLIPIYNTEKYLRQCLDSVVDQTYRNLEIICVDDGSTDSSKDIIKEYAERDSRIIPIYNKNNGVSTTRNILLDNARGDIVYFIDSDDYIDTDALRQLYEKYESMQLDLLFFDVVPFGEPGFEAQAEKKMSYYTTHSDYSSIYRGIDLYDKMSKNLDFHCGPIKYIADRNLIGSQRFINGIIHEDEPYTYELLLKSKRASYYHKTLYYRRLREDSIMTKEMTFENVYGGFKGYWYMVQMSLSYSGGYDNLLDTQKKRLNAIADRIRNYYLEISEEERKKADTLPLEESTIFHMSIGQNVRYYNRLVEKDKILQRTYDEKAERGVRIKELERRLSSKEYKLGRMLLWLPKKLKHIIVRKKEG